MSLSIANSAFGRPWATQVGSLESAKKFWRCWLDQRSSSCASGGKERGSGPGERYRSSWGVWESTTCTRGLLATRAIQLQYISHKLSMQRRLFCIQLHSGSVFWWVIQLAWLMRSLGCWMCYGAILGSDVFSDYEHHSYRSSENSGKHWCLIT
jgi:hypothetical protein